MHGMQTIGWIAIRRRLGKFRRGCEAALPNTTKLMRRASAFARACGQALALSISVRANRRRSVVLIGLIAHLGDIVACEPIARFARSRYPDALIVWCVLPQYKELLAYNPHIDQVVVTFSLTGWKYLLRFRPFDQVIDLHFEGRTCGTFGGVYHKRTGDASVNFDNYYENCNLLAAFCKSAGLPMLDDGPRVYIPEHVVAKVQRRNLPQFYCVVHCSSNVRTRDWELEKWHALVEQLRDQWGAVVVEIGLTSILDGALTTGYLNLCGKLTILETAEVIRRSCLFIGIDSGPAHLANAAGTPGIILLGKYLDFDRYLPYSGGFAAGENADLIYSHDTASAIPLSEVLDKVARHLVKGRPSRVSDFHLRLLDSAQDTRSHKDRVGI